MSGAHNTVDIMLSFDTGITDSDITGALVSDGHIMGCGLWARFCPGPRRTPKHSSESTVNDLRGHSGAAPALGCGICHTALFEGALGEPTWFAAHARVVSARANPFIGFDDPCLLIPLRKSSKYGRTQDFPPRIYS